MKFTNDTHRGRLDTCHSLCCPYQRWICRRLVQTRQADWMYNTRWAADRHGCQYIAVCSLSVQLAWRSVLRAAVCSPARPNLSLHSNLNDRALDRTRAY